MNIQGSLSATFKEKRYFLLIKNNVSEKSLYTFAIQRRDTTYIQNF